MWLLSEIPHSFITPASLRVHPRLLLLKGTQEISKLFLNWVLRNKTKSLKKVLKRPLWFQVGKDFLTRPVVRTWTTSYNEEKKKNQCIWWHQSHGFYLCTHKLSVIKSWVESILIIWCCTRKITSSVLFIWWMTGLG